MFTSVEQQRYCVSSHSYLELSIDSVTVVRIVVAIVDEKTMGEFFVLFTFGRLKPATIVGDSCRNGGFDVEDEDVIIVAAVVVGSADDVVVVVVTVTFDANDEVNNVVVNSGLLVTSQSLSFADISAFSSLAPPNVSSMSDVSAINGTDLMPEVSWVLS